jgi:hypothetical protein
MKEHRPTSDARTGQVGPVGKRAIVIIPIKDGSHEHVRRLVAERPPFARGDPELERRHVFVAEGEVVIFLEGTETSLERVLAAPSLAAVAAAWGEFVASPPRVAEDAPFCVKVDDGEGLSFEPTPGPGYSEGGDLYPP